MNRSKDHIALVKQAQLGDRESLDALTELFRGRLYSYVYRIVLREDFAQDIVQESMLEMFKVLGKLEKTDRFWPWLRGIAFNKIRRYHTQEKNRRTVSISSAEELEGKSGESESGLANLVAEELKQVVVGAMGGLKPQYRKVLTMRCYEEMEYSEIAEMMECSELSARVLFCRAKRALQKQLSRKGFGRGFLVTALILFGRITAPSKAAAANVSVTASLTKVGIAAGLVAFAGSKATILSLTTAGVLTGAALVATSGNDKTAAVPKDRPMRNLHVMEQTGPAMTGIEECWYYYPVNVNGPVAMRLMKWDSQGKESYCQWWQDRGANYYFDRKKNTIYINNHRMWNKELAVRRLPTDNLNFRDFISMVEGKNDEMEYVSGEGYGLLVIVRKGGEDKNNGSQIIRHYNVLDEEYFRYKWPAAAKVVDNRDAMHLRGWTYFKITGECDGEQISGVGRIPLVYATSRQNYPWLSLEVGEGFKIVDSGVEACVYDRSGKVVVRYDAGTFFRGLGRPWLGLHTIDTVRRDAAQERMWFETSRKAGGKVEILLTCEKAKLLYTIDLEKDVVEKITFSAGEREGELRFSYLQDIDKVGTEFIAPRRISARKPQRGDPGTLWLVRLAEGKLGGKR